MQKRPIDGVDGVSNCLLFSRSYFNSRRRSSSAVVVGVVGVVGVVAVVAFANRVGFAGKYLHRSRMEIRPSGGGGGRGGRRGRRCGSSSARRCAGPTVGAGDRGGPCAGGPSSPTPSTSMSPAPRRCLVVAGRICFFVFVFYNANTNRQGKINFLNFIS